MAEWGAVALAAGAGAVGGAMNALAGGGTFATLPALLGLGLPANVANATSNVALLPGAGASVWSFRDELGPVAGVSLRRLHLAGTPPGVSTMEHAQYRTGSKCVDEFGVKILISLNRPFKTCTGFCQFWWFLKPISVFLYGTLPSAT